MVAYPEEIVEIGNLLMKDIADSKDNIDAKLVGKDVNSGLIFLIFSGIKIPT
jgi:hypothetical protein